MIPPFIPLRPWFAHVGVLHQHVFEPRAPNAPQIKMRPTPSNRPHHFYTSTYSPSSTPNKTHPNLAHLPFPYYIFYKKIHLSHDL